jgi:hypothetical protein
MKPIVFLFFIALLLPSCGKKRTIVITATNAATGERYPGLEYSVVSSRVGAVNGEGTKTVASGVLNENGEAVVELREKRNRRYVVRVVEPANTCYNKQINMFFDSPFDENGYFNFEFAKCAYLKLNINNVNCQGSGDIMNFRSRYSYSDWEGWSTDRIGCYSVVSPYPFEVPAGWRIYEWSVNRNGVVTNHLDSIYLYPGVDNGTFNMDY